MASRPASSRAWCSPGWLRRGTTCLAVVVLGVAGERPRGADAASTPSRAESFLSDVLLFTARDLRDLDQGRPVVNSIRAADDREIATISAIRLRVSPEFYGRQARDIVRFKRHAAVLQIGTFSSPARASDIEALSLDAADVKALERCRPARCDVQMSSDAIAAFRAGVRWGSRDAPEQANAALRAVLVDLVNGYRTLGESALMTYADRRAARSASSEFLALIESPPRLLSRFAVLYRRLTDFPSGAVAGVDDVVYWSKERIGPATVVSVTHMAISTLDGVPPVAVAIGSRQLYASRHFDASLGLTLLLRGTGATDTYLVYLNRSRASALGGVFGGLKRMIVGGRSRAATTGALVELRDRLQREFAGAPTARLPRAPTPCQPGEADRSPTGTRVAAEAVPRRGSMIDGRPRVESRASTLEEPGRDQAIQDSLTDVRAKTEQPLSLPERQGHPRHLDELRANAPRESLAPVEVTPFIEPGPP